MKLVGIMILFISAIFDIHNQKIPAGWLLSSVFIMTICRIYVWINGIGSWRDFIFAFVPGILIYLFSRISGEIGSGDGLLVIITGCLFSWKDHFIMLFLAFFLAAVFSMGLILVKHDIKNRRIAFAPFLFVASGMVLCL